MSLRMRRRERIAEIILVALGSVLLLAGISGGGFNVFGVDIPRLDVLSRILAITIGVAILALYLIRHDYVNFGKKNQDEKGINKKTIAILVIKAITPVLSLFLVLVQIENYFNLIPPPWNYPWRSTTTNEITTNIVIVVTNTPPRRPSFPKPGPFKLKITTKTADENEATTDLLGISVLINNQQEVKLDNKKNNFQRGRKDEFEFEFTDHLSEVRYIDIKVNGNAGEWLCEKITFQFFQGSHRSKPIEYVINQWFSTSQNNSNHISYTNFKVAGKIKRM